MNEVAPDQAPALIVRLREAAQRLADFPRMGRIVEMPGSDELRQLSVGDFRILYQAQTELVAVAMVLHTAQDVEARLHDLRMDLP